MTTVFRNGGREILIEDNIDPIGSVIKIEDKFLFVRRHNAKPGHFIGLRLASKENIASPSFGGHVGIHVTELHPRVIKLPGQNGGDSGWVAFYRK